MLYYHFLLTSHSFKCREYVVIALLIQNIGAEILTIFLCTSQLRQHYKMTEVIHTAFGRLKKPTLLNKFCFVDDVLKINSYNHQN